MMFMAYVHPFFEAFAWITGLCVIILTLVDLILLFADKEVLMFSRSFSKRMDLGDPNTVHLRLHNTSATRWSFVLAEAYPEQMQERSAVFKGRIVPNESYEASYTFRPYTRGKHAFGHPVVLLHSLLGFAERKIVFITSDTCDVHPSVLQMRKHELMVFQQQKLSSGLKRIRMLGNTNEFEQIKNYVQGDDIKRINWKATSRRNELMTNQYQEEKAQQIYCVIDKGRSMQNRFDGMTYLDHAINSSLVLSNVALRKGDRAGLVTFSDKMGVVLPAEKKENQLRRISAELYDQRTHFLEPDFERLYLNLKQTIKTRSLLILFTHFETETAMRRHLPMLRKLNQKHLLVVVFFENTEVKEQALRKAVTSDELYLQVISERMATIQHRIALELKRNGIQTVLTSPEHLSVNTINKYLELKAKGRI